MFISLKKKVLGAFLFMFFFSYLLTAQNSVIQKYETASVYAGIEVGSKGVKMSFVEIDKLASEDAEVNILKDTTINTDFISFTQPTDLFSEGRQFLD